MEGQSQGGSFGGSALFRPRSVVDSQATTPVSGNHQYGENPAPENESFRAAMLSSMIDNSGRATAPATHHHLEGGLFGESSGNSYDFGSASGAVHDSLGQDPFRRSHSAAPESPALAPPPGLPALDGSSSTAVAPIRPNFEAVRRPASTGILDSSGSSALRPSAKTLMDLIQEDHPQEDNQSNDSTTSNPTPSNVAAQGFYGQQQGNFGSRQQGQYLAQQPPSQDQFQNHQVHQLQNQMQQLRMDSAAIVGAGQQVQQQHQHQHQMGMAHRVDGGVVIQNQNVQSMMAQQFVSSGFDGRDAVSPEISPSLYSQARQQQQPQVFVPGAQMRQSPPQGTIVTNADGQQVFYQQQVEVSSPRLQAQVLPNGQTIYIQTAPQPQPAPQPSYGYSTMQFGTGADPTQPQPRVVSAASNTYIRQSDGTLVPVSVQDANTPQMGFWQSDANSAGQGQTGVVIVGAPGASNHINPQVVGHLGNGQQHGGIDQHMAQGQHRHGQQHHNSHQYGRGRGEKNSNMALGGQRTRRGGHQARGRAEPKGHSTSSPLLDEFRSNKNRQWTIPQIEGHVVEFCQDQNGSRFIQQRLELGDRLEQDVVVREVLPSIRRLRNDVFGNYVVQKLLDFGSPQVRASIRDTLEGEMLQLSLQMYGCRVVQKALEALSDSDLSRLLCEFHHNVLSCIHDQNGNHVIQKCIEVINSRARTASAQGDHHQAQKTREQIDFIINDVLVNATTLSCHPFGCRVLQRILEHCDEGRKTKLLDEVLKSHKRLLDDQYGNYVIQHVLQYGRVEDRDSILAIVVESGLLSLSRQKFASNVVEKLLKYGNAPQRKAIAREMLKTTIEPSATNIQGGECSVVLLMVRDAYANYVTQTLLDVLPDSDERTALLQELNRHSEELVSEGVSF